MSTCEANAETDNDAGTQIGCVNVVQRTDMTPLMEFSRMASCPLIHAVNKQEGCDARMHCVTWQFTPLRVDCHSQYSHFRLLHNMCMHAI